ncbi:hypothetical protein NDQ71_00330 [Pseudoalteromonas sp. KG3]|uniref:hypothetical protein n=1 Tax=Pseudoalteromonas sp. KG3 TaxID=2951137 RepID=UPI0026590D37|nr:hypothetical protein [Pseudoalteromonas sp. KG3]WKD23593.1 hypothetical protein NDQ71_00330 [Pseudoalteromonas sp. KG3]
MEDLEIRLAMLNPALRARMKSLEISSGDEDILFCIDMGENTSSKIANSLATSVQSISLRLKKLRDKGYLTRTEVKAESGGYEFEYKCIYKI